MKVKNDPLASRRQFVGSITAGLAGIRLPGPGQPRAATKPSRRCAERARPVRKRGCGTQYPATPFPPQKQEPPGLVSKMAAA